MALERLAVACFKVAVLSTAAVVEPRQTPRHAKAGSRGNGRISEADLAKAH